MSFLGTCGVTQLPIFNDEEVMLFPLVKNINYKNSGGFCYAEGKYKLLMLPLFGNYNEYGAIHYNKDINDNFIEEIKTLYIKYENYYLNILNINNFDVFNKIDNIEDFLLKILNSELDNVDFMMVKKSIFNEIIEYISNQNYFWENTLWKFKVKNDINEYIRVNILYDKSVEEYTKNNNILSHNENFEIKIKMKDNNVVHKFLFKHNLLHLKDFLLEKNEYVKNLLYETILFNEGLEKLRKCWVPQSGAGSYDFDYILYEKLFNYGLNEIKKYNE